MSQYTKTTNFASKDNLSPGNPLKIVKGTEIDTEFNNIQTAVGTKTDNASANITGGTIVGITDLAVADGGTGASTATAALNNLLPSQTSNANKYLQTDGTNASWDAVSLSTADITGTLPVANGGTGVTSSTGTGNVVLSNSPTLVTPALGTPASGTATNLTGLPISTGVSGLGTGVATFLGTPSSANLASAVTDETGSGALVFANSPTLVTPALGTPSALVGTNITGTASGLTAGNVTTNANLTGAITSTGNATSLGSFSSANLLGALTDETGTGSAVFATSPTLVTPILGTPTSATLTNATGLPIATGVSGLGTGVATALAVNVGSAGAPVVNGGALGTPSSGTATNLTGLPLSTGVTGTLPIANGGTGQTTATAAFNALAPSQATNSGKYLTTDGTNTSWATVTSGSGDVVGPASSTDNAFARFDSTTGKLLQNSTGATLSDTGGATFTGSVDVAGTSTAGSNIKLYEDTDNGTNYVAFKAPDSIASNVTWTLPSADGTNTQVLQTNGSGVLSFATVSGGASAATPTALGTVYGKTDTGSITFVGYQAGNASSSAAHNVAVGASAMAAITTGSRNIVLGSYAAGALTTGEGNIVLGTFGVGSGTNTFSANTSGSNNIAIGGESLNSNTTVNNNIAVGYRALSANTTGTPNLAIGISALQANTTGGSNTALGDNALRSNTTASNNTAVGYQAGYTGTTAANNSWVGYHAGRLCTGNYNTGMGDRALAALASAEKNSAFGMAALITNTTGSYNTGIGSSALEGNTTGNNNTAVGYQALLAQTTSNSSVALGNYAGLNITTGNENLMLGYDSGTSGAPGGSITTQSNRIVVGSGRMTNAYIQIAWTVTSDARDKTDVVDAKYGLNFVNELRPVEFKWDKRLRYEDKMPNGTHKEAKSQLGFLAQDVIALEKKYGGIAKDLLIADDECDDLFSITETKMIPVLVKAIQELKAEFDAYKLTHP